MRQRLIVHEPGAEGREEEARELRAFDGENTPSAGDLVQVDARRYFVLYLVWNYLDCVEIHMKRGDDK